MLGFWSSIKVNNIPLCVYAPLCLCVYPTMIVWVASSTWSSWMMLPWTCMCKYLFESVLPVPFVYTQKRNCGIVWHFWHYLQKCGHQFLMFLKTCHTVFHGGCIILHSHQQCTKVSISPRPCKVLLFSNLLLIAILMDMKWWCTVMRWVQLLSAFFQMRNRSWQTCPRSPGPYVTESEFKPESILPWLWVPKHDARRPGGELEENTGSLWNVNRGTGWRGAGGGAGRAVVQGPSHKDLCVFSWKKFQFL